MTRNRQKNSNKGLLFGILAATAAVGGITAALANTKKGREFREDLHDAYNNASKKFTRAANTISEKSLDLSDRYLNGHHRSNKKRNMAIGAITGGLIGLSAMMMLSSKKGKGFREQLIHSFESLADKAHSFEDMAHSATDSWDENVAPWIEKLTSAIDSLNEHEYKSSKKSENQPLEKILDWASVAAQIYQSLKK